MARIKDIPGINVPSSSVSNRDDSKDDWGKGIWGVAGIGTPVREEKSSTEPKKPSFWRDALLSASGVVGTDHTLLEIQKRDQDRQRQEKAGKRATRAEKKEDRRSGKQEKKAATTKTIFGLFELFIGAATGNAVITAKGVADSVDGMVDTMKARQKRRSTKKNPDNMASRPNQSSQFIDLAKTIFNQKKTSVGAKQEASQKPSQESTMNGVGNNMPEQDDDIIEGEFTIIDDRKPKQLTGSKKS